MPPQPGVFAVSHSSTHKVRSGQAVEVASVNTLHYEQIAGPSSRPHGAPGEDPKKDKRRKEVVGKITKEMAERREDIGRHYAETISDLHSLSIQLATRPETSPQYQLRLYPISLERGALLSSIELQERHALSVVQTAYDEERERVEEEWKRGRDRIRERMLEGIEDRRRRAREEKDGEGTVADGGVDSQSRPHITRKLRNKMGGGTSPPPTPIPGGHPGLGIGAGAGAATGPVTTGPLLNPHSLSVDELPSLFPLPLISGQVSGSQSYGYGTGAGGAGNGRRRAKGGGREAHAPGTLGKALGALSVLKEPECEADLGEIRRGNKRRRAAAGSLAGKA
ncbi:hypothetical protein BD309DRAFT_951718 [Dichomitus squalens]|uniref:Sds3-like-domain-containing protein n=1 Tax=Dichomitus squalens TaxID=114155 RepID=A0A4Q9MTQ9_9APHY|nr:hypothetical protein BD311DRAFT_805420 [Dichomitus squalens]TBU47537.1 hypothetical protein BD309DRAFT_951718 [Dichomitus squalens]TBU60588.1 hypothetical protein BD310DRAFT_922752 [Dichomitus squalens]